MNRIHRIVWNAAPGVFQVASELARARGGKSGRPDRRHKAGRRALTYAAAAVMLAAGSPTATAQFYIINGGTATTDSSGNVTFTGSASNLTIYAQPTGIVFNNGTISGTIGALIAGSAAVITLPAVVNNGVISATAVGIQNSDSGIGTLSNSGTIDAPVAIYNSTGTIAVLRNQLGGTISAAQTGIFNGASGPGAPDGVIGTLSNSGLISGGNYGINNTNGGTISVLQNLHDGIIRGTGVSAQGISNSGTIGTLSNSGSISGHYSLYNTGTILVLQNQSGGVISGSVAIVNNGGTSTLSNSGTISGVNDAVINNGSIGTFVNSGLIKGNVSNSSLTDLNIQGGTGSGFGTFTGYTTGSPPVIGSISNSSSDINFVSGNILLNDNVVVGLHALNNSGTGVLQVNNPITITGHYNQGTNATLQLGVGSGATTAGTTSDSGYGRLVVSSAANVDSGSSIRLTGTGTGYGFAAGQRYLVIQGGAGSSYGGVATQGGVGTLNYSIANYTSSIAGNAVTDGTGLDLVLTVNSASLNTGATAASGASTAPNAMAAFGGLARYAGLDPQGMNLQNAAAYANSGGASPDQANRAGKQLAPSGNAGGAASSATMAAMDVVGSRMGGAGSGGYASMDGSRLGTGIATGEATRDWTAWGQAFGGHANQSQRDQVDGYSATYGGILLGIDKDLHNNWRAGGAFSYSNTYVSNSGDTNGNSAHINGYGLIGYARYQGDPWYVNLSATAANQQYSTSRAITSIPGFSGTAQGKFSGMQYAARAEAGYPIPLKNDWILTPLGSLTYSYQNQNAYTESGGNGAGLSVGSTNANSIKSGLGARLEKSYSTSYGQVVPFIQAQWIHEYNTSRQATTAGFSIDPSSTAFTTYGASPIADMADVSLGVTLIKSNNLSVSARYEVQAARGFFAQTGFVKLQMKF